MRLNPLVYQLASNRKGHFVLDIVYFLTRGHTNFSGHPRVHVMEAATTQHEENHFIEFMPLGFDARIQEAHDSHHTYRSEKLQKSHRNLLKLHGNTQRLYASPVTPNSSPPDLPCNGAAEALDQTTEKLTEIQQSTRTKADPQPFDDARKVGPDLRDPRMHRQQWPCYGSHQPAKPRANTFGQWVHCRLEYTPVKVRQLKPPRWRTITK